MDGIAVRHEDIKGAAPGSPVTLRIVRTGEALLPGTACVVDTGDALPPGADSIVMKEYVLWQTESVQVAVKTSRGQHVRKIGEDIRSGNIVLPENRMLGPSDIAALLASGIEQVRVLARPLVTVIPTGNEIVDSPEPLEPGYIRDVNSHMLAALFSGWGAVVHRHAVVPDDYGRLHAAIARAVAESDIVVINAGTSTGTEDFTAKILRDLGRVCCHGVAIRPGRPVILAEVGKKPVIGLPGYPVSCMLAADLFLRDLVHEFQRRTPPERRCIRALLCEDVRSKLGVEEFVRVTLSTGAKNVEAVPLARGASLISSLTQAHGRLEIPVDREGLTAGEMVKVELFENVVFSGDLRC
jgi:putative molybdopterin biosynthesis protein